MLKLILNDRSQEQEMSRMENQNYKKNEVDEFVASILKWGRAGLWGLTLK
jgi:hypothetical protein